MKKAALAFVVALVALPAVSSAVSAEDLLAQIKILQAQVVALQAATQVNASCDLPSRTLKPGMSGFDVSNLQQFLARDSSVYPEAQITGYYGSLTTQAVRRFQMKNSIVFEGSPESTGFGAVGPRTLAEMRKQWCLQSEIPPAPFIPTTTNFLPGAQEPQTTTVAAPPPTPPQIMFTSPAASTSVNLGNTLMVSWKSEHDPQDSSVMLSLETREGKMLGVVATDLSANGTYYWMIPKPLPVNSSCTGDPITCISQLAQEPSNCQSFCSLPDGLYKLYAQLISNVHEIAHAESRIFSIGGVGLSNTDIALPGTQFETPSYTSTTSYSQYLSQQIGAGSTGSTSAAAAPQSCLYSGILYNEGITVVINCADVTVAGQSCGNLGGMQLTCAGGKWVDGNGVAQSVRNVTNIGGVGSCVTPWNAVMVANGNEVPRAPFFTNGVYATSGLPPIMKCSNGRWLTCDTVGTNCH